MQIPDFDLAAALSAWLRFVATALTDATSPFWWPSLLAAGLGGAAASVLAGASMREVPGRIFPHGQRRAFLRELPVDLACWLAGSTLPFLLGPVMYLISFTGMAAGALLLAPITGMPRADAPAPGLGMLAVAAVLAFGFGDFMLYWTHRLFHRVPLLWRAHRLHHAPAVLTPLTAFRFWPQETLVHLAGNLAGQGFALGLCSAVAGTRVSGLTVLGVNAASLAWGLAFAHLRHSHVPLPFPRWLSRLLISPHMHQVHHSVDPAHHDRNFGTAMALWDWMFGTLHIPAREERFRFGLGGAEAPDPAPAPVRSLPSAGRG